jgi:hypothetical protein
MPTTVGNITDVKVYQDEYYNGLIESIDQNVRVLNEGANGAIRVITANTRGQYETQSFFKKIDNLVIDRDPESTAELAVNKLTQGEVKDILRDYTIGPVAQTLDAFRKIQLNPSYMSFVIGQNDGDQVAQKFLNEGLAGLIAAMSTETAMVFDNTDPANAARTGATTISARALNRGRFKLGDRAGVLRALVMNSACADELWDRQLTDKLGEVSGSLVYGAQPGTLNMPLWVTDSPALSFEEDIGTQQDPDLVLRHRVLMLTEGALVIEQQPYMDILTEVRGGRANLSGFYQAESSYLTRVKGFTWIGGNSPTAGEFADSDNWEFVLNSHKDGPGVLIIVNDIEPV